MQEWVDKEKDGRITNKKIFEHFCLWPFSLGFRKYLFKKKKKHYGWLGQEGVFQTGDKTKNPQVWKEKESEYVVGGGLEEEKVRPLLAIVGVGWEGFAKLLKMSEKQSAQLGA